MLGKFLPSFHKAAWVHTAALSFILAAVAAPAAAQISDMPDDLTDVASSRNNTYIDIGGAVLSRPAYLGSDDRVEQIIPYVDAEYKGRFFIKPALGAGVHFVNNDRIRFSTGVSYQYGRQASESESLAARNVEDIDDAFTANASLRILTPVGVIDSLVTVPFTGNQEGLSANVAAITQVSPLSNWRINPGARITFRNSAQAEQLYGAPGTALAAGFDGRSVYAGSLFAVSYFTLGESSTDRGWDIVGLVEYAKLFGNVQESQFAERSDGFTFTVGLAKKF
jgi:outer membrane scaffolding protein for murein synthesis (MipA/OmpV family)